MAAHVTGHGARPRPRPQPKRTQKAAVALERAPPQEGGFNYSEDNAN